MKGRADEKGWLRDARIHTHVRSNESTKPMRTRLQSGRVLRADRNMDEKGYLHEV